MRTQQIVAEIPAVIDILVRKEQAGISAVSLPPDLNLLEMVMVLREAVTATEMEIERRATEAQAAAGTTDGAAVCDESSTADPTTLERPSSGSAVTSS